MFGLYPAGPRWARRFVSTTSAAEIRACLVNVAGFSAGMLLEPFGKNRGAVIASHQGFLVMVETDLGGTELIVVPDASLQNLLWSVNSGYASQWSDREIKILTGHRNWDELLIQTSRMLKVVSSLVEQAIEGTLVEVQQVQPRAEDSATQVDVDTAGDDSWTPGEYDNLVPVTGEDLLCVL